MEILTQYDSSQISEYQVPFYLTGITHGNCQSVIRNIAFCEELDLIPDPDNKYDKTAVRVVTKDGSFVGWVPGHYKMIFKTLMKGIILKGIAVEMKEPDEEYNFYNVKIKLYKISDKK